MESGFAPRRPTPGLQPSHRSPSMRSSLDVSSFRLTVAPCHQRGKTQWSSLGRYRFRELSGYCQDLRPLGSACLTTGNASKAPSPIGFRHVTRRVPPGGSGKSGLWGGCGLPAPPMQLLGSRRGAAFPLTLQTEATYIPEGRLGRKRARAVEHLLRTTDIEYRSGRMPAGHEWFGGARLCKD